MTGGNGKLRGLREVERGDLHGLPTALCARATFGKGLTVGPPFAHTPRRQKHNTGAFVCSRSVNLRGLPARRRLNR